MQSCRITTSLPRACRPLVSTPIRTISTHFPQFLSSDFAPLWRVLDDSLRLQTGASSQRNAARVFHPRFDVREAANSYELHGELPGIKQEDLDIQFVDPHTLVIKGRTEREFTKQSPEAAGSENAAAASTSDENAPQSSPSYHKATVEDDYVDAGAASSSSSASATPTSSTATEVAPAPENTVANNSEPDYKYWVSERSVGEFTRTFQFPGTVDQEAVKASLKNGILSVVVPKLVRAERRIVVE